jgi:hypothetical protein
MLMNADEIRPDWEMKLNAVKAAAARKASRRIVMRQVGYRRLSSAARLIPGRWETASFLLASRRLELPVQQTLACLFPRNRQEKATLVRAELPRGAAGEVIQRESESWKRYIHSSDVIVYRSSLSAHDDGGHATILTRTRRPPTPYRHRGFHAQHRCKPPTLCTKLRSQSQHLHPPYIRPILSPTIRPPPRTASSYGIKHWR